MTETNNTGIPGEDSTPMWSLISSEVDKALLLKFQAESFKVINSWSMGNASVVEKDAAVSFLVQLGIVQITVQSDNHQTATQEQVTIQFGDGQNEETKHADSVQTNADYTVQTIEDVCSQEITVTPTTAPPPTALLTTDPQPHNTKEKQIDDEEDNENYSGWMSESDDRDDDDDTTEAEGSVCPRTTPQPREEHPCPNCHVILYSMWELDLHKVEDCKESTQQVYNCDLCTSFFHTKLPLLNHLHKIHDCDITSSKVLEKLDGLKRTKRQNCLKEDARESPKKGARKSSKKEGRTHLKKDARKTEEPSSRRSCGLQNLKESRERTKRQKVARRKKRTVGDVQEEKTQSNRAKPDLKLKVILKRDDTMNRRSMKPENSTVTSDVEIANQRRDPDQHRNVETSNDSPNDNGQGSTLEQVSEKEAKNPIIRGEPVIDSRNWETSSVLPVPKVSEAELEENDCLLTITLGLSTRPGDQGSGDGRGGGNEETMSNDLGEKKSEDTDSVINGNQDGTVEPCEVNEEEKVGESDDVETKTGQKKSRKSGKLVCSICHSTFFSEYYRRKHIFESHKECRYFEQKCSTCGKNFTHKQQYKTHLITHAVDTEREKYHCTVCNKTYLSKYNYEYHMATHDGKSRTYQCKWCNKNLTSASGLAKHVNSKHTKEKTFPCELCGKVFYTADTMRTHVLCHNKEERAFKCEECGKGYVTSFLLKRHKEYVHSMIHQCLCKLCGAYFKSKQILKQHHNNVHANIYCCSCEVCGKKFKRTSHRNAHMKIHSSDPSAKPFKCELCGKCFRNRSKLKVHMDWHGNIRSHTCVVCSKSFLTKGNLTKHMYTHLEKKPHECRVCSRGFSDMPGLRKHLDVVHKIALKKVRPRIKPEVTKSAESALVVVAVDKPGTRSPSPATSGTDASEDGSAEFRNIEDSAASDGEVVREALLAMMNA